MQAPQRTATATRPEAPAGERRHLIVIAHPNPDSFNHAILGAALDVLDQPGQAVIVSDLYAEGFDPLLAADDLQGGASRSADVAREQRRVAWADDLVFLFPVWWFDRPAILKGWCDRVLEPGFAYGFDAAAGRAFGLLGGKRASVVATFAARADAVDPELVTRGLTEGTLGFCGVQAAQALPLFEVPRVGPEERAQMLDEVRRFLGRRHVPDFAGGSDA